MVEKCIEIGSRNSMEIYGYNISEGMWRPGGEKVKNGDIDPIEMLTRILALNHEPFTAKRRLFLWEHFDVLLENRDPLLLTKLRLINDHSSFWYTVVLMGMPYIQLPEIIDDIPKVYAPILDTQDLESLLVASQRNTKGEETAKLLDALAGLTFLECENLLSLSLAKMNRLDSRYIKKEKISLLSQKAQQLIQLCEPEDDLSQVGGLDVLKDWLLKRGKLIRRKNNPKNKYLPYPKGILLTGPPGCGKSFLVSALGGSWKVNLVRLDPTRLFSSLVGQTEQNFRTALKTVKSLAPCILWIDEFEKFFPHVSSGDSDGGVLSRVLGLLLDFLQTNREGVFVCATANNITVLPQETIRAGRFDAVFFIDLPNRQERKAIFKVILEKYGLKVKIDTSEVIINATENFSGAEIEQGVIDTLYEYADSKSEITEFMLLQMMQRIVPLANTMDEQISLMRRWCQSRARHASYSETGNQNKRRRIYVTHHQSKN
jgi:AAA+ superfamily predicted ATPase